MNQKKHEPRANPKTQQESEEDDTRTELTGEFPGGAKLGMKFGRRGDILIWMVAFALFILSLSIGFGLVVSALKNAGVLGCLTSSLAYCLASVLALWLPSSWR